MCYNTKIYHRNSTAICSPQSEAQTQLPEPNLYSKHVDYGTFLHTDLFEKSVIYLNIRSIFKVSSCPFNKSHITNVKLFYIFKFYITDEMMYHVKEKFNIEIVKLPYDNVISLTQSFFWRS